MTRTACTDVLDFSFDFWGSHRSVLSSSPVPAVRFKSAAAAVPLLTFHFSRFTTSSTGRFTGFPLPSGSPSAPDYKLGFYTLFAKTAIPTGESSFCTANDPTPAAVGSFCTANTLPPAGEDCFWVQNGLLPAGEAHFERKMPRPRQQLAHFACWAGFPRQEAAGETTCQVYVE